ncbi:hypothetical protein R3P38DRAFT_101193 [Favolaschia claudopus]|uniref:Uncharacterized protein n=1 Tax=Favolaschia claudopus TaxID=2862362 RepID=A0AAV9ZY25_9AGAR
MAIDGSQAQGAQTSTMCVRCSQPMEFSPAPHVHCNLHWYSSKFGSFAEDVFLRICGPPRIPLHAEGLRRIFGPPVINADQRHQQRHQTFSTLPARPSPCSDKRASYLRRLCRCSLEARTKSFSTQTCTSSRPGSGKLRGSATCRGFSAYFENSGELEIREVFILFAPRPQLSTCPPSPSNPDAGVASCIRWILFVSYRVWTSFSSDI